MQKNSSIDVYNSFTKDLTNNAIQLSIKVIKFKFQVDF